MPVFCIIPCPKNLGRGQCPLPEKNVDFVSQNGDFLCILGVILYSSAAGFPGKSSALVLKNCCCVHAESKRRQNMPGEKL